MIRIFESRLDAGRQLAKALAAYRGRNPLVLAIPRGAVEMGAAVAEALGGELDVVLVRKLRSPYNPELAVGAIDESGWTYVAEHAAGVGADATYLAKEKAVQLALLRKRRAQYTPARAPADPAGRVAIVVDDLALGPLARRVRMAPDWAHGANLVRPFERDAAHAGNFRHPEAAQQVRNAELVPERRDDVRAHAIDLGDSMLRAEFRARPAREDAADRLDDIDLGHAVFDRGVPELGR